MRRFFAFVIITILALTSVAAAEGNIDLSSLSYDELIDLSHQIIDELTSRPEWNGRSTDEQEIPEATKSPVSETKNNVNIISTKVKNYVGLNLISCGYTSMGGDLRDYYGDTNLVLVLLSPDGTFIDPNDKKQLQAYTVIDQKPAANTPFSIATSVDGDVVNKGYEEIILIVNKTGEVIQTTPGLHDVRPSLDKNIQFVRNYTGRNLDTVGYTSMGGKRYDQYGPDGYVELVIMGQNGDIIDPQNYADFKYYVVTNQSVEADTEIDFTYALDADGKEEVIDQTIRVIQITAVISEVGQAALDILEAEEAALREAGLITELYQGTYAVGSDLEPGNYQISLIDKTSSSNVYVYQDRSSLDNDDREWDFIYGTDDKAYYTLREGMYLEIKSGAVKAVKSELTTDGLEFELYEGIFRIGVDLESGNYELTQISDSCNVHTFQNEEELSNDEGDWDFLYGEGDKVSYALKDGMILRISDGAVKATKK